MTADLRSARLGRQDGCDRLSCPGGVVLRGPFRELDEAGGKEGVGIKKLTDRSDTVSVDTGWSNVQFDNNARNHTGANGNDDTRTDNGCKPRRHAVGQEIEC